MPVGISAAKKDLRHKVMCVFGLVFAGTITMEDVISVLPFGGTYDLVQVKGSTLLKAFEHSIRRHGGSTGEFLQVSGNYICSY